MFRSQHGETVVGGSLFGRSGHLVAVMTRKPRESRFGGHRNALAADSHLLYRPSGSSVDRYLLNLVRDTPWAWEGNRASEEIGTWVTKLITPQVPSFPDPLNRTVMCRLVSPRREFPLTDLTHEHRVLAFDGAPYDPAYPFALLLSLQYWSGALFNWGPVEA